MNEQHDTFIAILENMSGKATNKKMKEELGWSDADYQRVRAELKKSGIIQLGRCRGGMVMFKEPNDDTTKNTAVVDPFPEGWRALD